MLHAESLTHSVYFMYFFFLFVFFIACPHYVQGVAKILNLFFKFKHFQTNKSQVSPETNQVANSPLSISLSRTCSSFMVQPWFRPSLELILAQFRPGLVLHQTQSQFKAVLVLLQSFPSHSLALIQIYFSPGLDLLWTLFRP